MVWNSLSSSITPLGSNSSRKPLWTWTCSWGDLMRFSFGWSQRCVCVPSSTRGSSFSRSSSRLLHSEWTSWHFICQLPVAGLGLYCVVFLYFLLQSCKEYRNLNAFFAVIMGLSNPAVSRLSQTWEVGLFCSQCRFKITFAACSPPLSFVFTETSEQIQEVLQWIWKLDGELKWFHTLNPASSALNVSSFEKAKIPSAGH